MMSSAAKERGPVKRGEKNGFSAPKNVDELNKEKKRRLILSDSDSDTEDSLVSFRMVDRGATPSRESSSLGDGNGVEGMKEEKTEVEVEKKRILRSDVTKHSEELLLAVKREANGPEFARKITREPAGFQQPAKKLKAELSEPGGKERTTTSGYKPKALQNGKTEIHSDKEGDSESSENDEMSESQTQTSSPTTNKREAEKDKLMELSNNQKLPMKDSCSSVAAERRDMTSISRCRDGAVRVQGKSGVLRLLPSNKKVDGLGNHTSIRKDDENSNNLSSCRVATRSASKQTTPSDKRVYGKSSFGATSSKKQPRKSRACVSEERRSKEPKTEVRIVSPKREKKRADIQGSKIGFKIKGSYSSKTSSSAKRTEKQKLRDQLKAILLNAGWTIDLRPRKGRNYEDSVYIPPEGQGGYWSITRAYEVYQEQLSRTSNVRSKNSSGRSSRTSSGSDSLVPMESLSILKRIVVNKRRRRKEEFDETQMGTMKKIKKTSDRRYPRDQEESEDDYDEIRCRKKSNSLSVSNSKTALGSTSHKHLQKGRNKQRGCAILARGSNHEAEAEDNDFVPYLWKRTVLSWMIDMGVLPINGKVKYMNQRKTKTKLEGWVTRDGINCSCCSKILTVSKFELHAGSKLLQPLQNIYLEDQGISLLQCQLDAWKKQDESERQGFHNVDVSGDDPNDDTCGICGDGGALICCDGCPSTFHLSCLGIEKLPPGDWHCTNCCCRYCGGISSDTSRKSNGTICSLLSCHQCEAKYHQDCVPESESVSAIPKSPGTSFCSQSCRKVFNQLQKILGTKNDLEAGFSWSVVRRFDEDVSKSPPRSHLMAECNSKIAVALAVMDECFLPIVDQRSGINLIHNVMYNCGSNFSRLNYNGFYSFLLERGDEIISVASIRIHGRRLAEMPFIGTRNMYRRQGMCRRLLGGIESALFSLNVEKLVIPAISELKDTWTNVFGFRPLEVSQELEVRSINLLVFPGTGLLQKPLLKMHSPEEYKPVDVVSTVEYDIKRQHQMNSTHESSDPPSVESNLHNSDQAVVDCINANKDEAPSESSVKISCGSADSPRSKCKLPEFKYLGNAGDVSINNLPEGGLTSSHDEDSSPVTFSTDQKADITLFDNHERSAETNKSTDPQECNAVSQEMSPNGFAPAFQKSGASSPGMLPNECKIFQHKFEDNFISPEFVSSMLKQKVKNGEPLLDYESHGITKVHSLNSVKNNSQASPEPNHDEKFAMENLKTRFDVVNKESDSALLPKSSATDEDSEPFAFEIVSRCINVGAGKESDPACSGGVVPNSDNRSRFFIQPSIVDCIQASNGTICESSLCSVKNCKLPGESELSDIPPSLMVGANTSDEQPDLTTPNVLAKSCHVRNDVANGANN